MTLTLGSLFSGAGGMDLGLERAGMEIKWNCEIDPYCCRVLAKHWPGTPNLGDVTTVDWSTVERVDVICGGYPCQPFSLAGRRGGAADARHLWPYFRDAIRELRPRYAVLENVPGHLSLGFADVLTDLAALGFDAEWSIVSAADVGAPHLRRRLFVVAYSQRDELRQQPVAITGRGGPSGPRDDGAQGAVADAAPTRRWPGLLQDAPLRRQGDSEPEWCGWWRAEPDVGRVAHGIPHRMDRLRALGNAVVPQVAELVGRRVMEMTSCS